MSSNEKSSNRCRSAKVKWNAAYALGNLFKNSNLSLHDYGWSNKALLALCQALTESSIYKVRINASSALRVPSLRCDYDDALFDIWEAILQVLEEIEVNRNNEKAVNSEVNNEHHEKYGSVLESQIFHTLQHLLHITDVVDLISVKGMSFCSKYGEKLTQILISLSRSIKKIDDSTAPFTFDPADHNKISNEDDEEANTDNPHTNQSMVDSVSLEDCKNKWTKLLSEANSRDIV
eukprot:TRINITY_DN3716_c0_g1_i2.p1 TRINITY_DN3716_c0_g1~~TRINITY_DN3716_c0_g1_i2.p1  ORF type:complete len:234 (+),score=25.78 TRINITY_DN3716_c0_g1_i2:384-1085(+)